MRRFIHNVIILAIPLIIYLIIIAMIDPFNYLNISDLVDNSVKHRISHEVEPHLFKLIDFENNPRRNITLGDSRTDRLYYSMNYEKWANLAYGGGSIKEMVETFWWVVKEHELDTVLIGLNLNLYNKYNKRFWVEETIETKKNFFSYAFNKCTFRSTFLICKSLVSKKEIVVNEPPLNKEEFWEFQLTQTPKKFFEKYSFPDNYHQDLIDISTYCQQNKIKLIFWIPPSFIDFQNTISAYNLEDFNEQFKSDLMAIGELYDYEYENKLTIDKDNFSDPLHFNYEIGRYIRDEITGKNPYLGRRQVIRETTQSQEQ